MRAGFVPAFGVLAVLAAGPTAYAQEAPDASDEPVRVYTNEDLDDLGPPPAQQTEPVAPEEIARRWAFVDSVLDRAYARIDADRRHELDRRMTEAEADALEGFDAREHYVLPYSYVYGPAYRGGSWKHGAGPGFKSHGPRCSSFERPMANLWRPIAPLHARPPARPF